MKKLFFLLISLIPFFAFSQTDTIPMNSAGEYEYSGIIEVDSATADKLYSNAKLFVMNAFKSGKDVMQMSDDNSKSTVGRGSIELDYSGMASMNRDNYVSFKFVIQCKDGKYRYIINNFKSYAPKRPEVPLENEKYLKKYTTKGMRIQMFEQVNKAITKLLTDLHENMNSQTKTTSDW